MEVSEERRLTVIEADWGAKLVLVSVPPPPSKRPVSLAFSDRVVDLHEPIRDQALCPVEIA